VFLCVSLCVDGWVGRRGKEERLKERERRHRERERERDESLLDPIPVMGFGCHMSWDFFYVPFRFVNPADCISFRPEFSRVCNVSLMMAVKREECLFLW
jgi:hypothetical protein